MNNIKPNSLVLHISTLLTILVCTSCDTSTTNNEGSLQPSGSGFGDDQALCVGGNHSVTLQWLVPVTNNDGSTLTDLSGYSIYYGTSPTNLSERIDIDAGLSAYEIESLSPEQSYYFAITSVNSHDIESDISNIICR